MKSLETLRLFVRVVERGSFLGVAEEAGTTQPRVTRHIQSLEAELGARLFERSTRGLTLTSAGERAYRMAVRMLDVADEGMDELVQEAGALRGTIRVVGPVVFGELVLADLVAAFQREHPEVRFELLLSDRNVNLIEEGAHCAFRGGVLADSSHVAVPLGYSTGVISGTAAYFEAYGRPSSLEDLASHRFATFHPRSAIHELAIVRRDDALAEPRLVPIDALVFATTSQSAARVAAAGHHLAVLPHYGLEHYAMRHGFEPVLTDYCTRPNPIHALFPSRHGITARTRSFVDFVAARTRALLAL